MWTPLDWAYIGGSYDALFPTLHHGYPMLAYRPSKFDPEEAFYVMAKHGVRNLMAVPTVLRMMMHAVKHPQERFVRLFAKLMICTIGTMSTTRTGEKFGMLKPRLRLQ